MIMKHVDINLIGDPERLKRFARALLDNEELNVSEQVRSAPFELSLVIERCMVSFSYTPAPQRQSELSTAAARSFVDVIKLHSYPSFDHLELSRDRHHLSLMLWSEDVDLALFQDALILNLLGESPTLIWSFEDEESTISAEAYASRLRQMALPAVVLPITSATDQSAVDRAIFGDVDRELALDLSLGLNMSSTHAGSGQCLRALQEKWIKADLIPMIVNRGETLNCLTSLVRFLSVHGYKTSRRRAHQHMFYGPLNLAGNTRLDYVHLRAPFILGNMEPETVIAVDPRSHTIIHWSSDSTSGRIDTPTDSDQSHTEYASLSGDGQVVISGWTESGRRIHLRDAVHGEPWPNESRSFNLPNEVFSVDAHHASGIWVMGGTCGGGHDGKISLFSRGSEDSTRHRWYQRSVDAVSISPDGAEICLSTSRHCLRLDVATFEVTAELEGHTSDVLDIVYSSDGRFIFTADDRGVLRRWDRDRGGLLTEYRSPDGQFLNTIDLHEGAGRVSAWSKHHIYVWDVQSGEQLQSFPISASHNSEYIGPCEGRSCFIRSGAQLLLPYSASAYQICDVLTGDHVSFLSLDPCGGWVSWGHCAEDDALSDVIVRPVSGS